MIQDESDSIVRRSGRIDTGGVVVTSAGRLPCKVRFRCCSVLFCSVLLVCYVALRNNCWVLRGVLTCCSFRFFVFAESVGCCGPIWKDGKSAKIYLTVRLFSGLCVPALVCFNVLWQMCNCLDKADELKLTSIAMPAIRHIHSFTCSFLYFPYCSFFLRLLDSSAHLSLHSPQFRHLWLPEGSMRTAHVRDSVLVHAGPPRRRHCPRDSLHQL